MGAACYVWIRLKKFGLQSMLISSLSLCFGYPLQNVICIFLISNFRRVLNVVCFLLGNSPGVWILYADVSEHSVCSIFIRGYPLMKMGQTERSEMLAYKFRRPGITQKKAYNRMHFSSPPTPTRVMFTTQLTRLCWITKNNRWTLCESSVT
jgi:hypothetical protein